MNYGEENSKFLVVQYTKLLLFDILTCEYDCINDLKVDTKKILCISACKKKYLVIVTNEEIILCNLFRPSSVLKSNLHVQFRDPYVQTCNNVQN